MRKIKFLLVLFLMLLPVLAFTAPSAAQEDHSNQIDPDDEGVYRIRIEASQWEFKAFDIVAAEKAGIDLNTASDADKKTFEIKHRIEMLGATEGEQKKIEFKLYSRDVQHGFSVNEMDIAVALNRPEPGSEFGSASTVEVDAPQEDVTYSAFCHIFCGLGHPDMKLKLVFGEGSFEFGPYVFYAALVVNVFIFGLTMRSVYTKISVMPEE